jgi:homogentisate 1,2-dioxygenase
VEAAEPVTALLIEATNSSYMLPDRGMVGQHAVFDPAVLDTPAIDDAFRAQQERAGEWRVRIKRRGAISTVTYPFNPLDAVGWKGDLAPVRLNVRDIRPLASHRYHLPPSAHTTFRGEPVRGLHLRAAPVRDRPGRAQGARSSTTTTTTTRCCSTTRATSSAATTSRPG